MTFAIKNEFAACELSGSDLEQVSGGIVITHGPNPPQAGSGHCHQPVHGPYQPQPIRYYPGGGPNAAGLQTHH